MSRSTGYWHEKELADRTDEDWVFSGLSEPGIISIPQDERINWLPQGELQNIGSEKSDCATRSPDNHAEALFTFHYQHNMDPKNKRWLEDTGYVVSGKVIFSDVFTSILSGTTPQGNSLIAPLKSIHSNGLIPKAMLPQLAASWEVNADPNRITQKMRDLGAEFARRFTLNYERVEEIHIKEALKDDMVGVAAYAWPEPANGIYPRTEGQPNHAFLLFAYVTSNNPNFYYAFDNYLDLDGDFIKRLAPDYDFYTTGYRLYLSKEDPNATAKQIFLYWQLIPLLIQWLALLPKKIGAFLGAIIKS